MIASMKGRKPDILDALMSEEHDEGEHGGDGEDSGKDAVIAIDDAEDPEQPSAEADSPEAKIESIRKGLDELEMMFRR